MSRRLGAWTEEDRIQASIVQMVEAAIVPGVIWFAIPNGGYRDKRTAEKLKLTGVRAGVPDLCFISAERGLFFLEVKTTTGSLSAAQKLFTNLLTAFGVEWRIARSRDEAQDILTQWRLLRIRTNGDERYGNFA